MTPSTLNSLHSKNSLASIRYLMLGGEPLTNNLADFWSQGRKLFNGYGPTETTVIVTTHDCSSLDKSSNPPIGRPIANSKLFVLDNDLRPVPIGVPGELYIGGAGVARGYLNRPELTSEKFKSVLIGKNDFQRLYKTGDIVRWNKNGDIEYIGRRRFPS